MAAAGSMSAPARRLQPRHPEGGFVTGPRRLATLSWASWPCRPLPRGVGGQSTQEDAGRGRLDRRSTGVFLCGLAADTARKGTIRATMPRTMTAVAGQSRSRLRGGGAGALGRGRSSIQRLPSQKDMRHRLLRQPGWLCEPRGFAAPPRDGCASSWIAPASDQRLPIEYADGTRKGHGGIVLSAW